MFQLEIENAEIRLLSSVWFLESGMIVESRTGRGDIEILDRFLRVAKIEPVSFDQEQAQIAREAFRRYGKRQHHARLNMGDCAVYALSKVSGSPILCTGNDFQQTDIRIHIPSIS